jgi:hypothetical protein
MKSAVKALFPNSIKETVIQVFSFKACQNIYLLGSEMYYSSVLIKWFYNKNGRMTDTLYEQI